MIKKKVSHFNNQNLIQFFPLGFQVSPEAQELLQSPEIVNEKVGVIAVAGKYRTGKSFLLNRILLNKNGEKSGFGVGPTINPCTKVSKDLKPPNQTIFNYFRASGSGISLLRSKTSRLTRSTKCSSLTLKASELSTKMRTTTLASSYWPYCCPLTSSTTRWALLTRMRSKTCP